MSEKVLKLNTGNDVEEVTLSPSAIGANIAAKGDLIVGVGANTAGILSVGANGYTLIADSNQTTGIIWQYRPHPYLFIVAV